MTTPSAIPKHSNLSFQVTLGLCLIGAVPFSRGGLVFISQMLGGMAAAGVVKTLFPGPLAVTTTLSGGTNKAQGVFIEMFLTAQLVFTIFMLAAEKHKGTFLAPVGIGLSLFIAELAGTLVHNPTIVCVPAELVLILFLGVYYTGGSLNPARSFGPCVANRSFPNDHWVYWVGPLLGALVASGFFWFIKSCEYETANPGQDFDDLEASAFNPEVDLTRPVISPNAEAPTARTDSQGRAISDGALGEGAHFKQQHSRDSANPPPNQVTDLSKHD
jgi:aquaporin rerated protein, other eukaryote